MEMQPNQGNRVDKPVLTPEEQAAKYKKALRLAVGVVVLLAVILAATILTVRSGGMYRAGYVDGWNDCRDAQIELMQQKGLVPDVEFVQETGEPNVQIQIVAE